MKNKIEDWTKERLKTDWILAGKKCVYRHGWGWKGARARFISQEEALKLLPVYSPGVGFYELDFCMEDGEEVLEFNELSANDML